MILRVISTGSQGNCYILENDSEILILECGVNIKEIKRYLNFNTSKVVGLLLTHSHSDHSKSCTNVLELGIRIHALEETFKALNINNHHNSIAILPLKKFTLGGFSIIPFEVKHDVPIVNYLIEHNDTGVFCFITDTFYSPYRFNGLNNLIIEANFCEDIIDAKLKFDRKFLRDRVLKSHLSIQKCIDLLNANDLTAVNNIVLIHLSDSNSNEIEFQKKVQEATGKNTIIARNGLDILFNKNPF